MKKPNYNFRIIMHFFGLAIKQDKKAMGRELALLKRLRAIYPDPDFWLALKPAIQLDSLTYFLGYGAEALQNEWTSYRTGKVQKLLTDRSEVNKAMLALEKMLEPQTEVDTIHNNRSIKKQTALDWADSL